MCRGRDGSGRGASMHEYLPMPVIEGVCFVYAYRAESSLFRNILFYIKEYIHKSMYRYIYEYSILYQYMRVDEMNERFRHTALTTTFSRRLFFLFFFWKGTVVAHIGM